MSFGAPPNLRKTQNFITLVTRPSLGVSRQTRSVDSDGETAGCFTWLWTKFWAPKSTRLQSLCQDLSRQSSLLKESHARHISRIKLDEQKKLEERTVEMTKELQVAEFCSLLEQKRLTFQRDEFVKFEDQKAQCAEESNRAKIQEVKMAALSEQKREANAALDSWRDQKQNIELRLSRLNETFSELKTRAIGLDISYELFQKSPGSRNVVLLGNTGDGKSTLANRLVGDTSKKGNCGPFEISNRAQSETSSVKSEIFEAFGNSFCLVDTPGMSDSSGPLADLSHANRLVSYLQGVEAIQAFLFVRNFRKSRLSKPDKDLLRELSELLGKRFWENVVFVFTRVDDEDDEEELEECGVELVEQIRNEFGLTPHTIPIVGIGKRNFQARREEILTTVLNFEEEFSCERLILPLDKLKEDMSRVQTEIFTLEGESKEIDIRIFYQEKLLDQIDHHLDDLR